MITSVSKSYPLKLIIYCAALLLLIAIMLLALREVRNWSQLLGENTVEIQAEITGFVFEGAQADVSYRFTPLSNSAVIDVTQTQSFFLRDTNLVVGQNLPVEYLIYDPSYSVISKTLWREHREQQEDIFISHIGGGSLVILLSGVAALIFLILLIIGARRYLLLKQMGQPL